MPSAPPRHRPSGHGAEVRANAQHERLRQSLRPSSSERGYDADWREVRALHLVAHPWCVVDGCGNPASDVDHIESVADAPDRRLDPTNLRSMCHAHHAQRTARDQSFTQDEIQPRGARHPDWMRKVVVPTTLVCGPPASGKSTLVARRAGPNDMVLDLDAIISKLSGQPLYAVRSDTLRNQALRWRNGRLSLLGYVTSKWPAAWLIVDEPRSFWRQWWCDKLGLARVIVLETPHEQCLDRINQDSRRPEWIKAIHREASGSWWSRYERRAEDLIIRPNQRITTGRAHHAAR